jgi:hypothetical protein
MKYVRVAVCLVAMLSVGAIGTATANAEAPEYGRCLKTAGGHFKNAKCTISSVPGEEKYEWLPGAVKGKFSLKIKEATLATFETVESTKMTCTGVSGEGEIVGPKTTIGSYVFTGCETAKVKCSSGGVPGTIIGHTVEGLLGIESEGIEPSGNHIANDLFPAEANGTFTEFECVGLTVIARGSVLNPTTANSMLMTDTLKWTSAKGKQKPEKFVGGPLDVCEVSTNGGAFVQCGGTVSLILTLEEKLEINTVI